MIFVEPRELTIICGRTPSWSLIHIADESHWASYQKPTLCSSGNLINLIGPDVERRKYVDVTSDPAACQACVSKLLQRAHS